MFVGDRTSVFVPSFFKTHNRSNRFAPSVGDCDRCPVQFTVDIDLIVEVEPATELRNHTDLEPVCGPMRVPGLTELVQRVLVGDDLFPRDCSGGE